jgi:hypothetical protein
VFIRDWKVAGAFVREPKRHHQIFKMPKVCPESRFVYILWLHTDLVVAWPQV